MSPLRPTTTSSSSSSSGSAISPFGVMLCALATLVGVPVLLSSGASSDGEDVAAVVVPETVSASELEADVDIDELFDAGADFDDVPDVSIDDGTSTTVGEEVVVEAEPQRLAADEVVVDAPASPELTTSTTISAAPATPAPETTTAPPTTAPPTTAAPTTAAPTTAPPTTAAPTTAAPTTAAVGEEQAQVATEAPQGAEEVPVASGPTAEQWAALRHCESSGNYSVVSSNGLYHGAYQFYQPTWDGLARQVGRTDLVGLPPSQAAPADQDALALLLWQQRGAQPWPHCGRHLPAGP